MVSLQDLTVGQVSGMIAAAIFVFQFLVPFVMPVILLGLLRLRSPHVTYSAVSWSVIGRFLHSSLWPVILQTDSAATFSSSKFALFVSITRNFVLVLIGVAAIVTPLGLYEGIDTSGEAQPETFHYIKDTSPWGFGTPPRPDNQWSRICGSLGLYPCPNSRKNITVTGDSEGITISGDWYDATVPQETVDAMHSGLGNFSDSVSSLFDIQWRSYSKTQLERDPVFPINNNSAYMIGAYRPLSTLLLSDTITPIEGLIVDMKNGGIGFRNHTAPVGHPFGSTWEEDVLFVEPESVCVDTNLTLDFAIPEMKTAYFGTAENLVITDRGGFVNLNQTYPQWNRDNVQDNPELWLRAYKAAWLSNALSMVFMNVTPFTNETLGTKAFSYLNSSLGKEFTLSYPDGEPANSLYTVDADKLKITSSFGDYISGLDTSVSNYSELTNTTYNFTEKEPLYKNPFRVQSLNFSDARMLCAGAGGMDYANLTNIAAECGLMYSAPRRKDNSNSVIFDPGSQWTLSMYSCISTAKATLKRVSFSFNDSSSLSGLSVRSIAPKTYADEASKPLWGVENTDMYLRNGNPLWGIVSPDEAARRNLSTRRAEALYLPGYTALSAAGDSFENMPGIDFVPMALSAVYDVGGASARGVDYSGYANLGVYSRWQELSRTPEEAALILNLIFTDVAANMVVGTKGLAGAKALGRRDEAGGGGGGKTPKVTTYVRRVKYKYVYGIPAFLTLVIVAVISLVSLGFMVVGTAGPSHMRAFLNQTSAGRLLVGQFYYGGQTPYLKTDGGGSTTQWVGNEGGQQFTLVDGGWAKHAVPSTETEPMNAPAPYQRVTGYKGT